MNDNIQYRLKQLRVGVVLALLTLLYGFGLGAAFGVAEDRIKGYLRVSAREVAETVYKNDKKRMGRVTDRSLVCLQRAHIHAGGMGTAALSMIILLSLLDRFRAARIITAIALGAGGLGYSSSWMFTGLKAPAIGNVSLARESFNCLAIPSVVLFISGAVAAMALFLLSIWKRD